MENHFQSRGRKFVDSDSMVEFLSGYQARAAERFAVIEPHFVKDASLGGRPFETLRLPIDSLSDKTIMVSRKGRNMMESASVSDLKRSPSGYFRKVKAGEEILITDRGRPIAKITPLRREGIGDEAQLAKLEAAGLVRIGKGFSPGFWDDYDGPSDPDGAIRAALVQEREER